MEKQIQRVAASAVIFNEQGKILLVKRAADDTYLPNMWEVPGGSTDFNEDPKDGVKREVLEECGLQVHVGFPLHVKSYLMYEDKQVVEIIYHCIVIDMAQEVTLSVEHSDYKWVALEEIDTYNVDEFIRDVITTAYSHPLMQHILNR